MEAVESRQCPLEVVADLVNWATVGRDGGRIDGRAHEQLPWLSGVMSQSPKEGRLDRAITVRQEVSGRFTGGWA